MFGISRNTMRSTFSQSRDAFLLKTHTRRMMRQKNGFVSSLCSETGYPWQCSNPSNIALKNCTHEPAITLQYSIRASKSACMQMQRYQKKRKRLIHKNESKKCNCSCAANTNAFGADIQNIHQRLQAKLPATNHTMATHSHGKLKWNFLHIHAPPR